MSVKKAAKRAVIKGLRSAKKVEMRVERGMKRRLGLAPGAKPSGSYVHPWKQQDLGAPTIVDQMKKEHCCGCESCRNACPKGAITMVEDEEGFLYPQVNHDLCIDCGICIKKCPTYNEQPADDVVTECYATIAADDAMRARSSSGGLFSQLAGKTLEAGGVVFGAAYDDVDTVRHRGVESVDDLDVLRRSKYVQSSTGDTFAQAKRALDAGRQVLYSGCPCQIAGLYAYLGKDYENLLTVDLICHGVPSPGLFRRYLKETYPEGGVAEINFRDKSAFGWSTHMNAYMEDGSVRREKCVDDPFYLMFLRCLAQRPFCSICKFTKLPRVADLSIGDWWGIEKYDATLNDGRGTSLALVNNAKGRAAFDAVRGAMARCETFSLSQARPRNYTIDRPFKAHVHRSRFFKLLVQYPFAKAVRYGLENHFDVGVYGLWYGENYGSVLTYYGLVKVLESMGLSSIMIANPLGSVRGDTLEPTQFARRQGYSISTRRPLSRMGELNEFCDSFVLGSDQLWNPGLFRPYGYSYFLSFVNPDRKRIAYGTSFGKATHKIDEVTKNRMRYEFAKFDAVSARDDFSRDLVRNEYGHDAVKVLDPAILCDAAHFHELAAQATEPTCVAGEMPTLADERYLFAYILDPNETTLDDLAQIASQAGMPVVVSIDMAPKKIEANRAYFAGGEERGVFVLDNPHVEQWLYAIEHAQATLTDSFHGMLFSFAFEKRFVAFPNAKRGSGRFIDVMGVLGLESRRIDGLHGHVDETVQLLAAEVDYVSANERLERERAFSRRWLKDALFSHKVVPTYRAYTIVEDNLLK